MERAEAEAHAREWVAAWNAHDVDAVLAQYTDDVVVVSPLIVERGIEPSGKLRGKEAVRAYYAAGLAARPELQFTLHDVFVGVDSLTMLYAAETGRRVAETLVLSDGKAVRVMANYGPA